MHLLVADDALPEGHRSGIYLAVCGAMLHASSLPSSCCPEGCECDLAQYCPACVCQAAEWVAPAGDQPDSSARAARTVADIAAVITRAPHQSVSPGDGPGHR
jgi:hypothetical protein